MPIDPRTGQTIIDPRVAMLQPDSGPIGHPVQGIGRLAKAAALRKVLNDKELEAEERNEHRRKIYLKPLHC